MHGLDFNIGWQDFFLSPKALQFKNIGISLLYLVIAVLVVKNTYSELTQRHEGILLNDPLLALLPTYDLTWPIFILLYSLVICALLRFLFKPMWLLLGLRMFALINTLRMLSLQFIQLAPPKNIVSMQDPIVSIILQKDFSIIQYDLFFSGHISNLLMILLVYKLYEPRWEKYAITLLLGISALSLMLMLQHIHYTLDIMGAIPAVGIMFYVCRFLERLFNLKSPLNNRH